MQETTNVVRQAVAESIDLDIEEVEEGQTLFGDLEMESIDLLDVFFRIEQSAGVAISANDLGDFLQGGIPDEIFSDEDDVLTAEGLSQLERVIPSFDSRDVTDQVHAEQILELVTVATLALAVKNEKASNS